ncbi:hypothetical protein PG993_005796 [Apiospora rasikravindrae]|uniref:Uncharacterized protein n=1 Tax=Apiospora rasikravindrae TaxID=990691 RepID=A0ABR1T9T8_9PEZI
MTSHSDRFLVGATLKKQWMQAEPPPLLPAVPPNDDAEWDPSLVVHGDWLRVPAERRHSGWDAVEQSWSIGSGESRAREVVAPATESIDCRTRGFLTAPVQVMSDLRDCEKARSIDPRKYCYRVFITMRTTDARYAAEVNTGMWVGTCLWDVAKVVYE